MDFLVIMHLEAAGVPRPGDGNTAETLLYDLQQNPVNDFHDFHGNPSRMALRGPWDGRIRVTPT
jgi:hypothetical protein